MSQDRSAHSPGPDAEHCDTPDCQAAVDRGDRWIGEHLSVEPDGRAHFHHTAHLHRNVRAAHQETFRRLCDEYTAHPDDFATAWHYLVNHPIFHRPVAAGPRTEAHDAAVDVEPEVLDDCDGLADLWLHVSRDDAGRAVVMLEHGPHLWHTDLPEDQRRFIPATGQSSHDPRLDVSAPDYETAIVTLAAKVRRLYGDDRTRVPYHED